MVWRAAQEVVVSATPDSGSGLTRWGPVLNVLSCVPWLGIHEEGCRGPTFFAKGVGQDCLDTPEFEGGTSRVGDLRRFCPAGPGVLKGLQRTYGWNRVPTQLEAMPMVGALLEVGEGQEGWSYEEPLELHDVQLML